MKELDKNVTNVHLEICNFLEYPSPATATPAPRHKNRHMAISREPSVVS